MYLPTINEIAGGTIAALLASAYWYIYGRRELRLSEEEANRRVSNVLDLRDTDVSTAKAEKDRVIASLKLAFDNVKRLNEGYELEKTEFIKHADNQRDSFAGLLADYGRLANENTNLQTLNADLNDALTIRTGQANAAKKRIIELLGIIEAGPKVDTEEVVVLVPVVPAKKRAVRKKAAKKVVKTPKVVA